MDSTQIIIHLAMTEMEIKVVHVISSSEEEKKRRVGGRRSAARRRGLGWRKPWLPGKDGGRMKHSEDFRQVRTEHGYGRMNSKKTELPAVDEPLLCYGLVCRCSVPKPSFVTKPTDEQQQQLHSFQRKRENGGEKKIREVKMAAWSELWSVFLPSPVSPQPLLSVLPQPVVFQSIGSHPSSHRACALPGL